MIVHSPDTQGESISSSSSALRSWLGCSGSSNERTKVRGERLCFGAAGGCCVVSIGDLTVVSAFSALPIEDADDGYPFRK